LDLAAAGWSISLADYSCRFFVFAEAWPRLDTPMLKGKGSKDSLIIHPGKTDTASNTTFLAADRRFAIAPGG